MCVACDSPCGGQGVEYLPCEWEKYYPEGWEFRSSGKLRTVVFSVGVNDAPYATKIRVGDKQLTCPAYQAWGSVLRRSEVLDPAWRSFSVFRRWYFQELEKTEMMPGEFYLDGSLSGWGRSTFTRLATLLVPRGLANLLNAGVPRFNYNRTKRRFPATLRINGMPKHLGYFDTAAKARSAWVSAKVDLIKSFPLPEHWCEELQQQVKESLLQNLEDKLNGR